MNAKQRALKKLGVQGGYQKRKITLEQRQAVKGLIRNFVDELLAVLEGQELEALPKMKKLISELVEYIHENTDIKVDGYLVANYFYNYLNIKMEQFDIIEQEEEGD